MKSVTRNYALRRMGKSTLKEKRSERHRTQRRADHRDPEARRGRIDDGGVMPTARIVEQTYYRWKATYGGMDSGEAKRLKQLEDENRKLKHVVAELTLDNRALYQARFHVLLESGASPGRTAWSRAKEADRSVPVPFSIPMNAIVNSTGRVRDRARAS